MPKPTQSSLNKSDFTGVTRRIALHAFNLAGVEIVKDDRILGTTRG